MVGEPLDVGWRRLLGWVIARGALAAVLAGAFVAAGAAARSVVYLPLVLALPMLARPLAAVYRMASGRILGVPIDRPYLPSPDRRWHRRLRAVAQDSATWRDVAWLVVTGVVGTVLYALVMLPFVLGFSALAVAVAWVVDPGFGRGERSPLLVLDALPVPPGLVLAGAGLVLLAVGVRAARPLLRAEVRLSQLLLAPTESARLAIRVRQLAASRAQAVDAQTAELRRIERDLHDGAQARLVSLGISLGLAAELLDSDPADARALLDEARAASGHALAELRAVVRGIHPPVLAERGLGGAVQALAVDLPLPVDVAVELPDRLSPPVESAGYFAVAEALSNTTKHSDATRAWVRITHADAVLTLVVGDDGAGGADPRGGTGLRGIQRRLAAFDGTLTLSSPPGGPTLLTMELPCASSSPRTSPSSATA